MTAHMGPASEGEAHDWLRLIRSENVGPATFFTLLDRCGTASAALRALPGMAASGGLRRPIKLATRERVARELEKAQRLGVRYLFWGDADYPERLAAIHAPPPVITVRGNFDVLSRAPLAVVGARKVSAGGRTLARLFSEAFGADGRVVVSGLALGVDAEAHRAALQSGTVAVVAGGADRPTPEEHFGLAEEIVAHGGAIVSEMPLGVVSHARDYPRRNRLIAGLSDAVLVVEAADRSGSLHTARYGMDANREVFAVPGSPLDPRAAGCLKLLREGASIAVEPRDVLSSVPVWKVSEPRLPGFEETAFAAGPIGPENLERLASAISHAPASIDALVRATGLNAQAVAAALVELELGGRAIREPDGTVRASLDCA